MDDFLDFSDLLKDESNLQPLVDVIESVMSLPDDSLEEPTVVQNLKNLVEKTVTPQLKTESVRSMIFAFEDQNLTREEVVKMIVQAKEELNGVIDTLQPSAQKRELLENVFNILYNVFDAVMDKYHHYNIELPVTLEDGARMPTYAHDTDAAADLYAADDVVVPAHSFGNMIRTGVHIGLPEGWVACILPRSSIGAKTPLRLSNSMGVIDAGYRGALGVLYDNLSDSDYNIKQGDRIAQLLVMPSYRFKGDLVEQLGSTDRGEGGFGSTGK